MPTRTRLESQVLAKAYKAIKEVDMLDAVMAVSAGSDLGYHDTGQPGEAYLQIAHSDELGFYWTAAFVQEPQPEVDEYEGYYVYSPPMD